MNARLSAIGMAVPAKAISNHDFEHIIDTNDEWIVSRTGIRMRYHTTENEFTSDLCVRAVENLVANHPVTIDDVDMILVATVTPDQPMPSMACRLQYRLGLERAGALDVYAACAGFSYAIVMAKGLIAGGSHRKILVLGAETLSKVTDFTDRTSCVLFGDGAGAVLIEADKEGNIKPGCITGASGEGGADLYISGMATEIDGMPLNMSGKIVQNGRKVFKWAVTTVADKMQKLAAMNDLTLNDIDWFIPHSANLRIIEAICKEVSFPLERVLESIVNYGNTSSASIPLALCQGIRDGRVKPGDRIMMFGFGGGLAYAGVIFEWKG